MKKQGVTTVIIDPVKEYEEIDEIIGADIVKVDVEPYTYNNLFEKENKSKK